MKKKILIIIGIILVVCAIVFEIVILTRTKPEVVIPSKDVVFLGNYQYEKIVEEGYVFTNYEDFSKKFQSEEITKESFIDNNYVALDVVYDSCSEEDITITDYEIKGNTIVVNASYKAKCGVCAPQNMYYLIKVDKKMTTAKVEVNYHATNNPYCNPYVSYKPLIYLYPEREMKVNVKLGYKKLLTVTYPKYNNGWNVLAKPNGDLIDNNGKIYYGLYWEGLNNLESDFKDGFIVEGNNAASFLEEKLAILGLNEREANEFIIYWLPKLEENEYNLIRFASMDEINEQMPLIVTPKPDTTIRVLMEYKPIDKMVNIKEQILTKVERKGFTVVEWGGSLVK